MEMEMKEEYMMKHRGADMEFQTRENDRIAEPMETSIFNPQENCPRVNDSIMDAAIEREPKEILEEYENYEQVDDLQHLIYIRSKTSLEKRIQNGIKTELIAECVEKTQIRNNVLLHKIQALKEEEDQLQVLKVIERTHYNCLEQELMNIKKATDIFGGQIELAKQFEINLQVDLKNNQDFFKTSSLKTEELIAEFGKYNVICYDISTAEKIFKEKQRTLEEFVTHNNNNILIHNEKLKKVLEEISEKELFCNDLKTINSNTIRFITDKTDVCETIKNNIQLAKEKYTELANNFNTMQSVNSEELVSLGNLKSAAELRLNKMSETETNLTQNMDLSMKNIDKLLIENDELRKENDEFCKLKNSLQNKISENNQRVKKIKNEQDMEKICTDREIDNVLIDILNTQNHIKILSNELKEQESSLEIRHNHLRDAKLKLVDLKESVSKLIERYEKYVEIKNTLIIKLNEQKQVLENIKMNDCTKMQMNKINDFEEWKKEFQDTINKTNSEYEKQKQQLQHSIDELKSKRPDTEFLKQELETKNITLKQDNVDVQLQLNNILEKKKCLQEKLSNAITLKDSLSYKYQLLQEEPTNLKKLDQGNKPSILKSRKFMPIPTTPTKNVTFRPTVSCETLSDESVDSFLDKLMGKSGEHKNESEFDRLLRSSSNNRKRRF